MLELLEVKDGRWSGRLDDDSPEGQVDAARVSPS